MEELYNCRSPFLEGASTRGRRRAGPREVMLQETYETPHMAATLRGDTIWETKLDQGNKDAWKMEL